MVLISDTLADNNIGLNDQLEKYEDIKKISMNIVLDFLNEQNIKKDNNLDIIIGYGTGIFKNNNIFKGEAHDFYHSVLYKFSSEFIEFLNNYYEEDEFEFILDITHGLNFNTLFVYKAVLELLEIIAYFKDVKFIVLNSDPALGDIKKANINIVEERKVNPRLRIFKKDSVVRLFNPFKDLQAEEKEKLGKAISSYLKNYDIPNLNEIYAFAGAFFFGMPLWICYFRPTKKLELDNLVKFYEENIEIKNSYEQKVVSVERKICFCRDFENLIKINFLKIIFDNWLSDKNNLFRNNEKTEVSIELIKKIKNEIYQSFPVESNRIDREINGIEKAEIKNYEFFKLSDIICSEKQEKAGDFSDRNFFAHAGFEYNSVEIKKESNIIWLRGNYYFYDTIINLLAKKLPG